MKTAEQIWSAYMQSTSEQNEIWKDLLDEGITFTGPVMQVKGKEAYIKTTEDFFRMVRNLKMKRYVANENWFKIVENIPKLKYIFVNIYIVKNRQTILLIIKDLSIY